jgi:hypothetical protein
MGGGAPDDFTEVFMGNESIAAVKQKLAAMKKIEVAGFSDPAKAAEEQGEETEALKSTVKALRKD